MPGRILYPRPEYPRPDFQRGKVEGEDWLNLNGPWQFRFDPERRGMEEQWFLPVGPEWRDQILVPFCWESLAAWGEAETAGNENYYSTRAFRNPLEVNRANHSYVARHEVGWYRRLVRIPDHASWSDKRVVVKVGASDFFTDAWCNGVHLGRNAGGYNPFEFDLTDSLSPGSDGSREGLLIFRVEDPMNNTEQPVGKQWHWYTSTSGIWQTVYAEPRSLSHIRNFRVSTDVDRSIVHFAFECVEVEAGEVKAEIRSPAGELFRVNIPITDSFGEAHLPLANPLLWSPEHPHLYRVGFKLTMRGAVVDEVRSYFGMRKIDSGPADDPKAPAVLRLNNIPSYLRGALYQSYHCDGVYTAGDVETLKNDIIWAKRFGFNFLRVHIKIDDPLFLYYADVLGILLMCDFPNFGEGGNTPNGRKWFEEMLRNAIRRDFNHPSIVAWCVFNETWGFGGQVELIKHFPGQKEKTLPRRFDASTAAPPGAPPAGKTAEQSATQAKIANKEAHAWVQEMWELTKRLDTTRLVEDMSVVHWEHLDYYAHGNTDINSWHFYIDDYEKGKTHIEKIVHQTFSGSDFNYAPGFQQKSQPLINSEYGGVGALDGNKDCSWSFKFLTNELRRHGQISAYIYTELHDVEWEYNGFLNYDRTPKEFGYDPRIINDSDTLSINFAPISRHPTNGVVKLEITSSHYSPVAESNVRLRWRLGGMDTWGRIHQDLAKGIVPIKFPHRRVARAHEIEFRLPGMPMLCRLIVEAMAEDGRMIASNFVEVLVSDGPLPHREETDRSLLLRAFPQEWALAEWSGPMSGREWSDKFCYGHGQGFYEWHFPLGEIDLTKARKIRFFCEASARRVDVPQTNADRFPTSLKVLLNEVEIHHQILVNHPHDSRGSLSFLHDSFGAYGYFIAVAIEGESLRKVVENTREGKLRLRCAVPAEEMAVGGLTIYGPEAGRYPISLLLIVEW